MVSVARQFLLCFFLLMAQPEAVMSGTVALNYLLFYVCVRARARVCVSTVIFLDQL